MYQFSNYEETQTLYERKKRILVIDDLQENVSVIREKLEQEGFDVNASFDGKTGIKKALTDSPDLILCDVKMPEMSGFEVMNILKDNPGTATIPFIFLSGKSSEFDIREGMRLGADDFLVKPFNLDELIKAINVRLNKKEMFEKHLNNLRHSISYSLPHELQTPLAAILGFTDYLIEEYEIIQPDEILDVAESIKESAGRLNDLVKNILTAVKLDALSRDKEKIRSLRKHSTLISKELIESIAMKKAKIHGREKDLLLEIMPAEVVISMEHFTKLIEEVLDNAFKFSEKGDNVKIIGYSYGLEYMFYFIDHGRGMTDEQISQIGEYMQFERMVYERKGAGLGLSIVRKILDIYCGELTIESIPFKQTLVSLRLIVS